MTESDALRVLDLPIGATWQQVRLNYRRMVRAWHPDKHATPADMTEFAASKMREINAAYEFLELVYARSPGATPSPNKASNRPDDCDMNSNTGPCRSEPDSDTPRQQPDEQFPDFGSGRPTYSNTSASIKPAVYGIGAVLLAMALWELGNASSSGTGQVVQESSNTRERFAESADMGTAQDKLSGIWVSTLGDRLLFRKTDSGFTMSLMYSSRMSVCSAQLHRYGNHYSGEVRAVFREDRSRRSRTSQIDLRFLDSNTLDGSVDAVQWDGHGRETSRFTVPIRFNRIE